MNKNMYREYWQLKCQWFITEPGPIQTMAVGAETNVTKPRRIYVNWTSPSDRDRHGFITSYIIGCGGMVC